MLLRPHVISAILLIQLCSCYTYRIYPKAERNFEVPLPQEKVYIINPELKKEYKILQQSGIYTFTSDSTDKSAAHIRLKPLERWFVCGNPLIGWAILLGQMPAYLPDKHRFVFEKTAGDTVVEKRFELNITTRYWFWDMFSKKNYNKTAGKALAIQYYK